MHRPVGDPRPSAFIRMLMSVSGCFVLLVIVSLLLPGCHDDAAGPAPTWTFLVYMDGDNNLESAAMADISEMRAVGSTDTVQVIVQLDLRQGVSTKRYRIVKGGWELLADLGELDMASPRTVTDFLAWAKEAYPADRTVLVLWNHGNGWDQGDGPSPRSPEIVRRSIFYDDDNGSLFLSNHQVRKAVQASGISLDLLGLDASIMGTIEALYEFKDLAPIVISSQEVGESHGWDYTAVLSRLAGNPATSAEDLARAVVGSYRDFFEELFYPAFPNYEQRHTIAAFRTAYFSDLATEVNSLAQQLAASLGDGAAVAEITTARSSVQEIDRYVQPGVYADLVDLDRLLGGNTQIGQLMAQALIAEYHGSARPKAHGMSIVFFRSRSEITYDPNYRNYDLPTNTGNGGDFLNQFSWDEFLDAYYAAAGL